MTIKEVLNYYKSEWQTLNVTLSLLLRTANPEKGTVASEMLKKKHLVARILRFLEQPEFAEL